MGQQRSGPCPQAVAGASLDDDGDDVRSSMEWWDEAFAQDAAKA